MTLASLRRLITQGEGSFQRCVIARYLDRATGKIDVREA